MGRIAMLTDRTPQEVLPPLRSLVPELKTEPLSGLTAGHLDDLGPTALIVDAEESPVIAYRSLGILSEASPLIPVAVVVARRDTDRFPWSDVADELLFSSMPEGELRVRLEMLVRRGGGSGEAIVRLGPVTLNTESYQVLVSGRLIDLTYKEFELLRFLMQSPERVFTRSELLQRVWGYDYYGGTRTVDVHVRRLRAKLGPEHESLILTVRGVGYAASESSSDTRS